MTDEQSEIWNGAQGRRWAERPERSDLRLANIHRALMALADPRPGEEALDIGCGCGTTTLELAERIAPGGAIGLDISEPMLAVARSRAGGATFLLGDAATQTFERRFDLIFSRFGVMFFADPVAAFAHVRQSLKPGGRLVFSAWCARAENAWVTAPLAIHFGAALPPVADGPGQFGLAARSRLESVLAQAGFADVAIRRYETDVFLGATLAEAAEEAMRSGELGRHTAGLPEAEKADLRAKLAVLLRPHVGANGVSLPGCCWLVRAN